MAGLSTVTAATVDPVSTQELRDFARLDDAIDSNFINSFIKASTMFCEEYTNKSFINRTLKMSLDGVAEVDIPAQRERMVGPIEIFYNHIELPKSPVSSVTAIKYYNDSDTESTWQHRTTMWTHKATREDLAQRAGLGRPICGRQTESRSLCLWIWLESVRHSSDSESQSCRWLCLCMSIAEKMRSKDSDLVSKLYSVASLLSPYVTRRYGVSPFEGTYRSLA